VNAVAVVVRPPGDTNDSNPTFIAVVLCPEGFVPPDTSSRGKKTVTAEAPFKRGEGVTAMSPFGTSTQFRPSQPDSQAADAVWQDIYGSASGRVYGVLSLGLKSVVLISTKRIKKVNTDSVLSGADKKSSDVISLVEYLVSSEKETLESLNIIKELKIADMDYVQLYQR